MTSLLNNYQINLQNQSPPIRTRIYTHMFRRLAKLYSLHSQSASYFRKLSNGVRVPSIVLTCLSGILAFMSTTSIVSDDLKNGFNISVGILAVISTMAQSFSSAFKYDAKVESHQNASQEYDKLLTRVKFEQIHPNEGSQFLSDLENAILKVKNKCNYYVPRHILSQWDDAQFDDKFQISTPEINLKPVVRKHSTPANSPRQLSTNSKQSLKQKNHIESPDSSSMGDNEEEIPTGNLSTQIELTNIKINE